MHTRDRGHDRDQGGRTGEYPERYPVLADEPVELRHPRRMARMIAASFAATIALTGATAYAGATYAIGHADSDLRHSRAQFAADLEQRRRERDAQQAAVGRDLCTVVTRLPADPDTDEMRRKYGCGPFVASPQPSEAAPGTGSQSPGSGSDRSPGGGADRSPSGRGSSAWPRSERTPAPDGPGQTLGRPPNQPPNQPGNPPGNQPPGQTAGRPPGHARGRPVDRRPVGTAVVEVRVCLPLLGCLL
jgi:hypothetical protein